MDAPPNALENLRARPSSSTPFDDFAHAWDAEHGPGSARDAEFRARLALLNAICAELGRPRVLDLGCATGTTLLHLTDAISAGDGVDSAPAMVAHARRRVRGARLSFTIADAVDFCLTCPERYDLVVLAGVLAHLPDQEGTLSAARDVLAPGGRVLVVSPHPWNALFALKQALDGGGDAPPATHHAPGALARLGGRCGLGVMRAHALPYAPWPFLAGRGAVRPRPVEAAKAALAGVLAGAFALELAREGECRISRGG